MHSLLEKAEECKDHDQIVFLLEILDLTPFHFMDKWRYTLVAAELGNLKAKEIICDVQIHSNKNFENKSIFDSIPADSPFKVTEQLYAKMSSLFKSMIYSTDHYAAYQIAEYMTKNCPNDAFTGGRRTDRTEKILYDLYDFALDGKENQNDYLTRCDEWLDSVDEDYIIDESVYFKNKYDKSNRYCNYLRSIVSEKNKEINELKTLVLKPTEL